jgi:thiol-disulfide isomerase/thioredoxin
MPRRSVVLFSALFSLVSSHAAFAQGKVDLKIVKYPELARLVRDQRGKVVVLDLWAEWCIPCKREFPRLVQLHEKYGNEGLVCISVSLDNPAEKDRLPRVIKFLESRKAYFTDVLLDEDQDFWLTKLNFKGPPCVYVFNREGKWVRFVAEDDPYTKVEKLVAAWLKKDKDRQ